MPAQRVSSASARKPQPAPRSAALPRRLAGSASASSCEAGSIRSQANTPGRLRNRPPRIGRIRSSGCHSASSAASCEPSSGGLQNTRQWCLASEPPSPVNRARSFSTDLAPSSLATLATTRPPGAQRSTACASSARVSSFWRGGRSSTSGAGTTGASSASTSNPSRCSASNTGLKVCVHRSASPRPRKAAPGRARRKRVWPAWPARRFALRPCARASRGRSDIAKGRERISATGAPF
ncbi:hypothetical protein QE386_002219 [Pseudoxanthomonas winnipegensis]|nr:hypothetical protein [Pseudoxanthomonas winnipegensis]